MAKYLLTLDAGTGSGRAVIFNVAGEQVGIGQQEWSHLSEEGVPNSMSFDCQANWKLLCGCIKEAIKDAGIKAQEIVAVSATSMREGIVLYDEAGKELWAVANVDARADAEVKELKTSFEGIEEEFYKTSGQTFALGALPRLLWVKKHKPKLYKKTVALNMISDWVLTKLSGVVATDPSNGGTTGVFSLQKRKCAKSMAKKVGLKKSIFPKVYETGEKIGVISALAAEQTGLCEGTAVVMGGGDVQLGAAGLGVVEKGDIAILGGTFWQQVVNIDATTLPPKNMEIRINPHVVQGQSQAEGITFFSGLIMRWFRDAFCELEKMQAEKEGKDVYTLLEEQAQKIPVGSYGIMPIFSDDMKYGKWYHASPSFLNLSINEKECNKASMFRSLQENACLVSAINLEKIFAFSGIEKDEIVFAGGASKGFLWPQILADVTGKTVKIPKVKEATALGAAMAAGVGVGLYKDLASAAKELVVWERTYTPNQENHKIYKAIQKRWKKLYKAQLKLVDEGLTTSMWKAPGL